MTSKAMAHPTRSDVKAKLMDFGRAGLLGLLVQPPAAALLLDG
jgi:hypothetical protein